MNIYRFEPAAANYLAHGATKLAVFRSVSSETDTDVRELF
jgi:hypothetical protein